MKLSKLSKKQIADIKALCKGGCTDSDIEDYCHDNRVNIGAAFELVSVLCAPPCCKTCKYVELRNMHPCVHCSRPLEDRYEEDKEKTEWLNAL